MDITITEKLKSFRKERGNTQEELANHLGISVQAVSKWERGEGYPDITLLPAIASYYDVSIDSLFGVEEIRKQEKIDDYYKKAQLLSNKGKTSEYIALWRKAYKEFPNNLQVIHELIHALYSENSKKNAEEIISFGERILKESSDNILREGSIQVLCYTYKDIGKLEEAKKYAKMMGIYHTTENQLMNNLLEGDEKVISSQQNIEDMVDLIAYNVGSIISTGKLNNKDLIKAGCFVLNLYSILFEDGDYGFYFCRVSSWNMTLAKYYAKDGNADAALNCLEKSAEYSIIYDTAPKSKHTSFMVNRLGYDPENTSKDYAENDSSLRLKAIQDNCFDFIRENERFKVVEEKLKKVAK